MYVNKYPMVVI